MLRVLLSEPYPMLGMGTAPLKRRRTRPSIPFGLRQEVREIRKKRSAWWRANFLVRFLTMVRLTSGTGPAMMNVLFKKKNTGKGCYGTTGVGGKQGEGHKQEWVSEGGG